MYVSEDLLRRMRRAALHLGELKDSAFARVAIQRLTEQIEREQERSTK